MRFPKSSKTYQVNPGDTGSRSSHVITCHYSVGLQDAKICNALPVPHSDVQQQMQDLNLGLVTFSVVLCPHGLSPSHTSARSPFFTAPSEAD